MHVSSAVSIKIQFFYTMHTHTHKTYYFATIYLLLTAVRKLSNIYGQQCSLSFRLHRTFFSPLKLFLPPMTCSKFKVSFSGNCMFQILIEIRKKKQRRLHVLVKNSNSLKMLLSPAGFIPQDGGVNKRTTPHCIINKLSWAYTSWQDKKVQLEPKCV